MRQYLSLNDNRVSFNEFGDEVVVVHFHTGHYYSITGTTAKVWLWLVDGHSVASISDQLACTYSDCDLISVQDFVQQLIEEDLLEPREAFAGEPPLFSKLSGDQPFEPLVLKKYDDMQDLIVVDPIHDVDDTGWPAQDAA